MTVENVAMGEQPIFSTKAHVFHIDPTTKKSWIPASSTAVSVSFFFDSTRNLYRIISVEGTKAVINSTITPSMTFTKTSQKFGQWSDVRANTVYGLGFASEADLNKFIEKFQEVKEATKSAQKCQPNGTAVSTPVTSASASPVNVRSSHAHIRAPSPSPAPAQSPRLLEDAGTIQGPHLDDVYSTAVAPPPNSSMPNDVMNANTLKTSLVAHQRSQSLSGLQQQMDSPKHQGKNVEKGPSGQGPAQSPVPPNLVGANLEAQLKYENDRLKLALAQSSANAKKWEVELQTLKNNNARLTSALQESTANVEEWKRQLQAYKDENARMKIMILELEASKGNVDAAAELKKELHALRLKVETMETDVREKEMETHRLAKLLQDSRSQHMVGHHNKYDESVKNLQLENESLKNSLSSLQRQLDATVAAQEAGRRLAETLHSQLGEKLHEIMELHGDIANALST